MKVKICGITNPQDADAAVALGADALGFIFAKSPRQVDPHKARSIIESLPPFIKTLGVFVNADPVQIQEIAAFCGLDMIQFHGDEPPGVCGDFMPCSVKAFQVRDESTLEPIKAYRGQVRAVLLDTYTKDKRGGTGKTFDWSLAVKVKAYGTPIILSGGLSPANIKTAISTVRPYAVDVNSGIEKSPGKKDHALMKQLFEAVRNPMAKET